MKKTSTKIILGLLLTLAAFTAKSQFNGLYAIPNWTDVAANSNGTTNTVGAPASIEQISSDGMFGAGTQDFIITIVQSGTISFNWDYSTVDGPNWDYPQYLKNGVATNLTGYNVAGSTSQSGTQSPIVVCAGDVFGF